MLRKQVLLGGIVAVALAAGIVVAGGVAGTRNATSVSPLPSSACGPLQYKGSGSPQFIIASDFPLQGASRAIMTELASAVPFMLSQAGWKAGKYTIGYQSCDDSTAQQGGYDVAKCTSNGSAYAADRSVIGLIGTFNSGCAKVIIPELNRASDGPVAMVSPANTYPGLTVGGPGTAPGEPQIYYPTGKRNYARTVWTDRFQGAAQALFSQRLHLKKVYVLTDKTTYGVGISALYRLNAKKLGIDVVGYQAWNPQGTDFSAQAAAVKQSGADGVFLGGNVCFQGGKVIKDLRAALGKDFPIQIPDGFVPSSAVWTTSGGTAAGVYISHPGIPVKLLKGAGAKFVQAFTKEKGRPPDPYTAYSAQATEVLLNAIAASDGTRADVTKHLFNLNIKGGILGNFQINGAGDTTLGTVTFGKIVPAGKSHEQFVTTITPPVSLTK